MSSELEKKLMRQQIFLYLNYPMVRSDILSGYLSGNIIVKLAKEEFQSLYFEYSNNEEKCELTILHLAICLDDEEFVDYLLEKKVDIRLSTESVGPVIFTAIRLQRLKYVKKIIDYSPAMINKRVKLVDFDFDRVIRRHHDDTLFDNVSYNIEYYDDYTPLEYAVNSNAYEIVEFLISRGAEVNYEELWDGVSPLSIAAGSNNVKMMILLIKRGADINFVDKSGYHDPPLFTACTQCYSMEAVEFLLSLPTIRINFQDEEGRSCLHTILTSDNLQEFDELLLTETNLANVLEAGYDVNLEDQEQKLAIDLENEKNRNNVLIIKQHIVKLMAADFYVCTRNVQAVSGPEFNQLRIQCNEEVETLKTTPGPISGFSCYELMHKCQHKLALRFKKGDDNKFSQAIKSKFNLYGDMIAYRLVRAGQRRKLFKKVEDVLYKIFDRKLPATFIHDIFFYLSNDELLKLSKITNLVDNKVLLI